MRKVLFTMLLGMSINVYALDADEVFSILEDPINEQRTANLLQKIYKDRPFKAKYYVAINGSGSTFLTAYGKSQEQLSLEVASGLNPLPDFEIKRYRGTLLWRRNDTGGDVLSLGPVYATDRNGNKLRMGLEINGPRGLDTSLFIVTRPVDTSIPPSSISLTSKNRALEIWDETSPGLITTLEKP